MTVVSCAADVADTLAWLLHA